MIAELSGRIHRDEQRNKTNCDTIKQMPDIRMVEHNIGVTPENKNYNDCLGNCLNVWWQLLKTN